MQESSRILAGSKKKLLASSREILAKRRDSLATQSEIALPREDALEPSMATEGTSVRLLLYGCIHITKTCQT